VRREKFTGDYSILKEIDQTFRSRQKNEPAEVCLLEIEEPRQFSTLLPLEYRADQLNPNAALPPNLWVGAVCRSLRFQKRPIRELLDIRARSRWVELCGDFSERGDRSALDEVVRILGAWRCSNCGHRGDGYRPVRCPHAKTLCGDAKIVPQIQWIRIADGSLVPPFYLERFRALGLVVSPDSPVVLELALL
jgi:hypothetical protein